MTPKQQRFVEEYLVDLNATQAYIRAGYSQNGAAQSAGALLRNPKVAAAVAHGADERSSRTKVSQDRVVEEFARLGFTNLADVASWTEETMSLRPSAELPTAVVAAVKEVKTVRTITRGKDGYEQERTERRITMHDKKGALDSLARHLGMFEADTTVNVGVGVQLVRNTRAIDAD